MEIFYRKTVLSSFHIFIYVYIKWVLEAFWNSCRHPVGAELLWHWRLSEVPFVGNSQEPPLAVG